MGNFWEELKAEFIGLGTLEALKAGGRVLLKSWGEKAGERIGDKTADWMLNRLFAESAEERRIELAMQALPPNEASVLEDRLRALPDGIYQWWVYLVLNESLAVMTGTMLTHAQLDDTDWNNKCLVMEKDCRLAEEESKKFFESVKKNGDKLVGLHSAARAQVTSHSTFGLLQKLRKSTGKWADDQKW